MPGEQGERLPRKKRAALGCARQASGGAAGSGGSCEMAKECTTWRGEIPPLAIISCPCPQAVSEGMRALLLLALAPAAGAAGALVLSPADAYGAFQGCGVSLAWWANVMGSTPDAPALADLAFNLTAAPVSLTIGGAPTALPSLGFNIARYNAGATSSRASRGRHASLSPNMPAWKGIGLPWYDEAQPSPAAWDWAADASQVAVLRAAAARGARQLELFSNSPPWWQLANGNPSGADDGAQDNLLPAQRANFAAYLAGVAAHARDAWGVTFSTVEAFNEPASTWWRSTGSQEGCHFDVATQEAVVALLAQALAAAGLANTTAIAASDDNRVDEALATWRALGSATRSALAQVNVHGYQEGGDRAGLYQAVAVQGGKGLRDSEYGDGDGSGATMAASFLADWAALHPNGWTYWQCVLRARAPCFRPPPPPPLPPAAQAAGRGGWVGHAALLCRLARAAGREHQALCAGAVQPAPAPGHDGAGHCQQQHARGCRLGRCARHAGSGAAQQRRCQRGRAGGPHRLCRGARLRWHVAVGDVRGQRQPRPSRQLHGGAGARRRGQAPHCDCACALAADGGGGWRQGLVREGG
jgi:hypothetical protein